MLRQSGRRSDCSEKRLIVQREVRGEVPNPPGCRIGMPRTKQTIASESVDDQPEPSFYLPRN